MSDYVKVNFGAVSGLASTITSQASQIENEINDLTQQIANLENLWTGSAGEGFQNAKRQWTNAANDLQQTLSRIGAAVNAAHDSYQNTEQKNTSLWG